MIESGYFMNAIIRDLEMVRADTMSFGFQVQGLKGQRPDFVQFSCKSSLEDEEYLFAVSLADTIDFRSYDSERDILTYAVRIPPEKTFDVPEGRYFYDLEIRANGDTITLMIGRLSIIEQVTNSAYIPPVEYENGDEDLYPMDGIPVGLEKLYTTSIISEIGGAIEDINDHTGGYTTAGMVSAIGGIGEEISNINEAVKAKTGETEDIPFNELATAISEIDTGSGDLIKLMENNSISNRIDLIDSVIRTKATSIDGALFREKSIYRISLSTITRVGAYAFYQATGNGREISMVNCVEVGEYAFKDYSRSDDPITTFNFPKLEAVGQYAFQRAKLNCVLDMPKLKTVYNNAFQEVYMTGLNVPLLETIGNNAFGSSWVGFDVELPSIVSIGNNAFYNFGSENFTIGENCTSIGNTIFGGNGVTNLFVLAVTPPTLAGEFRSGTSGVAHIYVPAESVNAYKSASVWSNYASIIEAIPS